MAPPLKVTPDELRSAGMFTVLQSQTVGKAAAGVDMTGAQVGLEGFATKDALATAGASVTNSVTVLSGRYAEVGNLLSAAATGFENTEQDNTKAMDKAGSQLAGLGDLNK